MTNTKAKVRKPSRIEVDLLKGHAGIESIIFVSKDDVYLSPKEARRLAAWLLKAADWIERKER